MGWIAKFLSRPNGRYIAIGSTVYIFELLVIVEAQHLGASAILAVGMAFWFGLIASFILQKIVTFKDKRMHHKVLIPQIVIFSALVLFNFGFTLLVTKLLTPTIPTVIARTIALGITTFWNFYLYKTHIFHTSPANKSSN